jgi:hypothetical protein
MVETIVPMQAAVVMTLLYASDVKSNSMVSQWALSDDYIQAMTYEIPRYRFSRRTHCIRMFDPCLETNLSQVLRMENLDGVSSIEQHLDAFKHSCDLTCCPHLPKHPLQFRSHPQI